MRRKWYCIVIKFKFRLDAPRFCDRYDRELINLLWAGRRPAMRRKHADVTKKYLNYSLKEPRDQNVIKLAPENAGPWSNAQ